MNVCRHRVFLAAAWGSLGFLAGVAPLTGLEITVSPVVLSGDAAPDAGAGVTFSGFGGAVINDKNEIAFNASLAGPGVVPGTNSSGIWAGPMGSLSLVVRAGNSAPHEGGGSAGTFGTSFGTVLLNKAGTVVFQNVLSGGGFEGVWTVPSGGGPTLVSREGLGSPHVPATITDPNLPVLDDSGVAAFVTETTGGLFVGAIYAGTAATTLTTVARTGMAAPGLPGVTFDRLLYDPVRSPSGFMAFRSTVQGPGIVGNNTILWSGLPGSLAVLAQEEEEPPGTATGVEFNGLGPEIDINDAGVAVFDSSLNGTGVSGANNTGIWTGTPGALTKVVREGEAATAAGAGVLFGGMNDPPLINSEGDILFESLLTGTGVVSSNNSAMWFGKAGSLEVVVREGDAAPGAGAGVVFGGLSIGARFWDFNGLGQVAVLADLVGTGVTSANDGALYLGVPGTLQLIAREGGAFEVGPGDMRTVSAMVVLRESGGEDGRPRGLSAGGTLVFRLSFDDGSSGIFKAVIEPPVIPVVEIEFTGPGMSDIDVSFPTENLVEYVLQTTTDLVAGFGDLTTTTGDGSEFTFNHVGAASGVKRYYRVVVRPCP